MPDVKARSAFLYIERPYGDIAVACKVAQRDLRNAPTDLPSTSPEFANGSVDSQEFLEQVRKLFPLNCLGYMHLVSSS